MWIKYTSKIPREFVGYHTCLPPTSFPPNPKPRLPPSTKYRRPSIRLPVLTKQTTAPKPTKPYRNMNDSQITIPTHFVVMKLRTTKYTNRQDRENKSPPGLLSLPRPYSSDVRNLSHCDLCIPTKTGMPARRRHRP